LPDPEITVSEPHVKQCQWIFDQAVARRNHLEQKAQATFGLMLFLVPLLAALFVFVISKSSTSHASLRLSALAISIVSSIFLVLGFLSATRAIKVRAFETLYLQSVIDESGRFKEYSAGDHARGLLYCASMNEAMNDHTAQFVKGAHIMTAAAVITAALAAIPVTFMFSSSRASPAETKIVGTVNVSLPQVNAIRDDVTNLKKDVNRLLLSGQAADDDVKRLQERLGRLDAKLEKVQQATSAGSAGK